MGRYSKAIAAALAGALTPVIVNILDVIPGVEVTDTTALEAGVFAAAGAAIGYIATWFAPPNNPPKT